MGCICVVIEMQVIFVLSLVQNANLKAIFYYRETKMQLALGLLFVCFKTI